MRPPRLRSALCLLNLAGPAIGIVLTLLLGPRAFTAAPASAVSTAAVPVASGGAASYNPTITPDGRFVLFASVARNLVTNDSAGQAVDLFVRDLSTHQTELITVNSSGRGGGDESSGFGAISSNGQFVVFESRAGNLVAGDTNGVGDIFWRDRVRGITLEVNVNTDGILDGQTGAAEPQMTPDGNWVTFVSFPSKPAVGLFNGIQNVFVRDMRAGVTRLVSVGAVAAIPTSYTNGSGSRTPVISPDGRWVAYASVAIKIIPTVMNTAGEIYLRDMLGDVTLHASQGATNLAWSGTATPRCYHPVFSGDGAHVIFQVGRAGDPPDAPVSILSFAAATQGTTVVATNASPGPVPEVSFDGRFVAYEAGTNVLVWDRQSGTPVVANINSAGSGPGNQPAGTPVLSADGTRVCFLSAATDLTASATNGRSQVFVRDLVSGTTALVSASAAGAPSTESIALAQPSVSADGRHIAFEAEDGGLVAGDLNDANDVFVRHTDAALTELISAHAPALASSTPSKLSGILLHSISADGQMAAFTSQATSRSDGITNHSRSVYLRDFRSGNTVQLLAPPLPNPFYPIKLAVLNVAVSADGKFVALEQVDYHNGNSSLNTSYVWAYDVAGGVYRPASVAATGDPVPGTSPTISPDGRWIGFAAPGLQLTFDPAIAQGTESIIVLRDIVAGSNVVVSTSLGAPRTANGASTEPQFSPDGRWLLFASKATDLVTNVTGATRSLFAFNLATRATVLVGPAYLKGAVFSADSRHVAWVDSLQSGNLTDLTTATTMQACQSCVNLSLSGDARQLVYQRPGATPILADIFFKDLRGGTEQLVTIGLDGAGANGPSSGGQLSPDGRFILFSSLADNLASQDANRAEDVFVRDRVLGVTHLLSRSVTGAGNLSSIRPVLSADGRTALFQSFASDLVANDFNERADTFIVRLGGQDTDGDGLDDDWEMTYFSTLARDGSGDADGDGQSDRDEFLAGTNPTLDTSLLRTLTVAPADGGASTILWSSVAGRSYRVQYKDDLNSPAWSDFFPIITATGPTASLVDPGGTQGNHRFYRVVRLP